ncbi:N-acetylglucosamine-6-phosphate deacetylase [Gordoniibacillus kamchatkensis]|uniref:N-acetylglucosamine-6-phosphate deacetylase n=1 Tax=Gordoniibacillus kamchatkensis TaxID=1590651 RepID=UPI000698CF17|nr:amidohydrolase family protein [Paenibacillus sp. VKM B-2647]
MTAYDLNESDSYSIEGIHYRTSEPISVYVKNGLIESIKPLTGEGERSLPFIGPGLVDLQINGYLGMDFNTDPLQKATVERITRALWSEGVTSYYPTIITNSDEAIEAAMSAIAGACKESPDTERGVAGIHLEGPFISPDDGPRGAHARRYVKPPEWSLFERWQEAAEGRIQIVTLSPEWPEAPDFIAKCKASGVVVSIGHTAAAEEQIREAVAAGAAMSTHLGNGAHVMLPRHPNYIWEQLANDELWTCLIADGFHLPESFLKVAVKAKGNKTMLVSDAVSLSGMPAGEYDLHIGGKVVLTSEGKLHLADNPKILAGSAQMPIWGIAHLAAKQIVPLAEAWDMASVRPSAFMGVPSAQGMNAGAPADLVQFEWDGERIRILKSYKQGKEVYGNER